MVIKRYYLCGMRFCFCNQPVWGTDKETGVGYCKAHQTMRTDLEKGSIMEKALRKQKQGSRKREIGKVRTLVEYQKEEGIIDTIGELTIDLDRTYSKYMRLAAAGLDLKVQCFTCSTRKDYKLIQCGHFVPRAHLGLRWEEINTKPQCSYCNINLRGNLKVFAENLEKERPGIVEQLSEMARQVYSPTRDELKQQLTHYQNKLRIVEQAKLK